jgi:hypothetical protein
MCISWIPVPNIYSEQITGFIFLSVFLVKVYNLTYGFVLRERKWEERKLRKSINEFWLIFSLNSFIDFRNFLSSQFLSFQPNGPLMMNKWNILSRSIYNVDHSLRFVICIFIQNLKCILFFLIYFFNSKFYLTIRS